MALDPALAGRVYASALSLLAGGEYGTEDRAITSAIQRLYYSRGFKGNYSEFRSVVNQAISSFELAETMNASPGATPNPADVPRVTGIPADAPQYLYRVLVTVDGPAGRATTVVEVPADSPESASQVIGIAISMVQNQGDRRGTNPRFGHTGPGDTFSGEIQSIGQRR